MSLSRVAQRAADVLDYIAQSRTPPSSREVFECLQMPRSSGYDMLRSLDKSGYLEKRTDGLWTLGNAIQELALSRFGLGRIAGEIPTVLTQLQEKTQEIAQLAVLDQGEVLITHVFGSLRSLHIINEVGARFPPNWTACGELLSGLTAPRGYSIGGERAHREICSIAAPLHHGARCVAAVGLVLPEERMRNSRDTLVSLVCSAAQRLTHALSH